MDTIGVRELRQHASRWLQRVRAGESFIVTMNGQPIAQLTPLGQEVGGLARLIADGRAVEGTGLLSDVEPVSGSSISAALQELREGER